MNKAQYLLEMFNIVQEGHDKPGDPYGSGSKYGKYRDEWTSGGRGRTTGKGKEWSGHKKGTIEDWDPKEYYEPGEYSEKDKEFMSKQGAGRKRKLTPKELKRRKRGY
jgi:hypothetical protein